MYQFYYAENLIEKKQTEYHRNLMDEMNITAIRPTMWEEHCLECSAPVCFEQCVHYAARSDGRCKRFENGILVSKETKGVGNQCAHVKFRKWANMMTILFPAMFSLEEYEGMIRKNEKLGQLIKAINQSPFPTSIRWLGIRTIEFLRRKSLRKIHGMDNIPDAFVFHGYSFEKESYRLIMEIYDDHTSVYKNSWIMEPGENLMILDKDKLDIPCWTSDYLVKIYPENNLEVEVDILWCDFVKGQRVVKEKTADKVKCVVWDLDNTLWDGILIETEDESSLTLNEDVLDTIKAFDERGVIQSIASKNDYEAAWPVVEKLGLSEYFLYPQIHWNAKSGSLQQIASNLNIGIDALALIDDSVFERKQVSSILPQVRVYDIEELSRILTYKEFDVPVTEESKKRRSMYQAEEKRKVLQNADNTDTLSFLQKCHLQVEIFEPKTEEEKLRCYELVIRTNQLNMSGRKYAREEFEQVLNREECKNFAFSCKDDFGSYGIVGFGQYKVSDKVLEFTEFAMSCRVAGKFVESALFRYLLEAELCENGIFAVLKTKKNELLRRTLGEIGFVYQRRTEDEAVYLFDKELNHSSIVAVEKR